jgi:hypothetical protein
MNKGCFLTGNSQNLRNEVELISARGREFKFFGVPCPRSVAPAKTNV